MVLKREEILFVIRNTLNHFAQNLSYRLKKPVCFPTMVYIAPTLRCNLQCKYCSIWKEGDIQKELNTEEWKKVLIQIQNWIGVGQHIGITGGEPFLRKDIFELIDFMEYLGLKVSITSNAVLLNEKLIKELSKRNIFNINISLESMNKKTHDFFRGRGNFDKTLNNILLLKKCISEKRKRTLLIIETTLTSENLEESIELLKFCEKNGLKIHFGNVVENLQIDYSGDFKKESEYKPKNERKINKIFSFLIKNKKNIVNSTAELQMMQSHYKNKKIKFRCSATSRNVFVNFDGEIKLCQYFPSIGNAKNDSIKSIWYSAKANRQRKIMKRCKKICQFDCYKRKSLLEEYEMYRALYC